MADEGPITAVFGGDFGPMPFRDGHFDEVFDLSRDILRAADLTFVQLEKNLSDRGTLQLNVPRSLARTKPAVAEALAAAGVDVVSFASKHTLAFSDQALFDTLDNLAANGIRVIGAGRNLAEAKAPAIFDIRGTTVGMLAYCCVVPKGFEAWEDKPGANRIRATTRYEPVDQEPGTPPRVISETNPDDLAAMIADIEALRSQVDVLVVSHHFGVHYVPSVIAMYQREIAHASIDAGADLIVGHRAHLLKGVEVYKGKVIFHSLGNFMMDHPLERVHGSFLDHMRETFHWELDESYPNYAFPPDAQKTGVAKATIEGGKIARVSFVPMWINRQGQPEPLPASDPRSDQVAEYLRWTTFDQRLNAEFTRDGDEFVVTGA